MTLLTTKLAALKDVRIARVQIQAAMLPQPEVTRAALSTSAHQRLHTAANLMEGADTKRPTAGIIAAARGAADAVAQPGHAFQDLHAASMGARNAAQTLRHEPDVARHIADRHASIKAGFRNAAF